MILQTFVENAVKHGLAHKEGAGHISLKINKIGDGLTLVVEDDGIGRAAALQYRGESTGKGMEIIREFIKLFNEFNQEKIVVEITDLTGSDDQVHGTRVVIKIPLNYSYALTNEETDIKNSHNRR
jgi:LytS/YehU family sensor histidine kinase